MDAQPFLKQVAQYYASDNTVLACLQDYAFVLPNRRSAQQLERYFLDLLSHNTLMPRIMSINDFVDHIMRKSNPITASPIENLFLAYKAYREVMKEHAGPFDKFAHWGQLIVNDFNDIDMNLVDASSLYTNLSDLKDIQANYIEDEDLKLTIREILGIHMPDNKEHDIPMWKGSTSHDDDDVKGRYLTLWNCLSDIYNAYGKLLDDNKLTSQGKLYRQAVEELRERGAQNLGFERVVMVGHDMLSASEIAIFKILNNLGIAHYWWDDASPALANENNPARKIIDKLASTFKSPCPIEKITQFPQVTVHYVPGPMAMAKCAFQGIDKVNDRTAIVLPDELLLEPILNSLPSHLLDSCPHEVDAINVTMGYSLRRSNISTLIHLVTTAHKHATLHNEKGWMFYREDVRDILSHPIIKMAYTDTVLHLNNSIEEQPEYNIPASRMAGTDLAPLFTTLHTTMLDEKEVKRFITNLETFCNSLSERLAATEDLYRKDDDDDDITTTTLSLQRAFIRLYVKALNQLRLAIDHVGLPVNDDTIFHLIARAAASAIVPFGGKSGKGLQVMGLLETRCIDFDDLRILSANEGVLPPKAHVQSLIPNRFRAAFNMPTIALNDATQAFRFYRLISRVEHLTLLSDTSNNKETTRFVEQLHKVYGVNVKRVKRTAPITIAHEVDIEIDNPQLRDTIKETYTQGTIDSSRDSARCLSASSIKEYIKCPLKFYFHHIHGLSNDNAVSDFMDSSQFGTIVHNTLQDFYYPNLPAGTERKTVFTVDDINHFERNNLDTVLTRQVNYVFAHKPNHQLDDALVGQAYILFEPLQTYVKRALNYDKEFIKDGSLEVIECEVDHPLKLRLTPGTTINFTFKADRIDRVGDTLRIIDYKTGINDITTFKSVDQFFERDKKKRPEAVLQLFLYCMAYVQLKGAELLQMGITHIEPIVYKLSSANTCEVKRNTAYRQYEQVRFSLQDFYNEELIVDFASAMAQCINELWAQPITQAPATAEACNYCNFTTFCRRERKE